MPILLPRRPGVCKGFLKIKKQGKEVEVHLFFSRLDFTRLTWIMCSKPLVPCATCRRKSAGMAGAMGREVT